MGFLDNSGDIILDAVLTNLGRKKMANGTFSISKCAFGDDEVDYGLYNKSHPSGSAYYDLEILQTPIMEAFSQANAVINYGLMTNTTTDLLYLPVLEPNEKIVVSNTVAKSGSVFYVADTNTDTSTKLLLSTALTSTNYFTVSNQYSGPAILVEAGLNTSDIKGDAANRTTYLASNNLIDNYFYVYYDSRFINAVLGPSSTSIYNNTDSGTGTPTLNYSLVRAPSVSTDLAFENYSAARVSAISNGIVYDATHTPSDTAVSSIQGPRSVALLLNFEVVPTLDVEYSRYGVTSTALFADGNNYSYLDTTVYIQGVGTGVQTQLPIRIIKYIS